MKAAHMSEVSKAIDFLSPRPVSAHALRKTGAIAAHGGMVKGSVFTPPFMVRHFHGELLGRRQELGE
jgi:hypothetical protein